MTMVDTGLDADLIARTRAIIPQLAARAEEAAKSEEHTSELQSH